MSRVVGVDRDLAARADPAHALGRRDELLGIGAAAGLLQHFGDQVHAVVAGDRHEVRPVLRIRLRIGFGERLVLRRLVHVAVVERRVDAERRVADRVEDVLVGQVAGGDDPDAGLREAAIGEALHERDRFGAGRQEQEDRVRLRVLDLLQVRREVRVLHRHAHLADDLAARRGEGLLELAFRVVAGTEVRDQRVDLLDLVLRGPRGDRRRVLRQRVRRAHDVGRLGRDDRRRRVHDHHRLLRLGRNRRHGERGRASGRSRRGCPPCP